MELFLLALGGMTVFGGICATFLASKMIDAKKEVQKEAIRALGAAGPELARSLPMVLGVLYPSTKSAQPALLEAEAPVPQAAPVVEAVWSEPEAQLEPGAIELRAKLAKIGATFATFTCERMGDGMVLPDLDKVDFSRLLGHIGEEFDLVCVADKYGRPCKDWWMKSTYLAHKAAQAQAEEGTR
jgi:hypothetical protein